MHNCAPLLGITSKAGVSVSPVSTINCGAFQAALNLDAQNLFFQGAVSLLSSIRGIQNKDFSWATVKAYYSVFYFLRSYLCLKGICIFYVGRSPYSILLKPGAVPRKERGATHECTIVVFAREYKDSIMLSNDIDGILPVTWLALKRNEANYTAGHFPEPQIPEHFRYISENAFRRTLIDYIEDKVPIYAFDPDHAMTAYPIFVLRETRSLFLEKRVPTKISEEKSQCLLDLSREKHGPIKNLYELMT